MSLLGLIALGAAAFSGSGLLVPKPLGIQANDLFSVDAKSFLAVGEQCWLVRNGVPEKQAGIPGGVSVSRIDSHEATVMTNSADGFWFEFGKPMTPESLRMAKVGVGGDRFDEELTEGGSELRYHRGVISVSSGVFPSILVTDVLPLDAFCVSRDKKRLFVATYRWNPKLTVYGGERRENALTPVIQPPHAVKLAGGGEMVLARASLAEFERGSLVAICAVDGLPGMKADDNSIECRLCLIDVKTCRAILLAKLPFPPPPDPSRGTEGPDGETPLRHQLVALPGMDACAVTWYGKVYLIKGISSKISTGNNIPVAHPRPRPKVA